MLLGNYAHLVASGFEHKAYLVANSRPKETTETPSADDGEEQASSAEAETPAEPEGETEKLEFSITTHFARSSLRACWRIPRT